VPFKILVVDNELEDLEVTRLVLSTEADFEIVTESDSTKAIEHVRKTPHAYACILLDYLMPKDGLTTAQEMFVANPNLQIAILSSDQSRETLKKSIQIGVKSFIDKDEDPEVLRGVVRSLCQKWQSRAEIFNTPKMSDENNEKIINSIGLVGRSPKLVEVAEMVKRAAAVSCSVIIQGESGTGKELIARAVHNLSKRKLKPFVAINVNAIAENLAESELFGHVRGAFTGADKDSPGKILSAQGGTLFLDEIGDLKPEIQVKLLRVLQDRKLSPVGSNKVYDLDVRIITATHVNLEKAILDGKFREDLFYRLHVFPIQIPPLRERPEDIQPLIAHFLKLYNGLDREVMMKTVRVMERYEWRGNIRELENEIQRLLSMGTRKILPSHLSKKILDALNFESEAVVTHHDYQKKLWQMELEYIERNIKVAGSLREACRSIFDAAPSSIHTRMSNLKEHLTKSNLKGVKNEQTI
jgi:two-component system response regulator AtoC